VSAEPAEPLGTAQGDILPTRFLNVRIHDLAVTPSLTAVCAGYEDGHWRAAGLARHMLDWVPDFALRLSERQAFNTGTGVEQMRRAMQTVFGSGSTAGRGEPGEILLHIVCREVFGSDTVVNKVFFKTAGNDVVKGFDAVHIVNTPDGLELWLGEAKFYTDRASAIRDALTSIRAHLGTDYLRGEFSLITDKIDNSWPYAQPVRRLIHENVPIQDVFRRITIPVLLAYDSPAVGAHHQECAEFSMAFAAEMRAGWERFARGCPVPVQVRLFLAPLGSKQALVDEIDGRLPAWR
jgi:Cap4 SAVED domain